MKKKRTEKPPTKTKKVLCKNPRRRKNDANKQRHRQTDRKTDRQTQWFRLATSENKKRVTNNEHKNQKPKPKRPKRHSKNRHKTTKKTFFLSSFMAPLYTTHASLITITAPPYVTDTPH